MELNKNPHKAKKQSQFRACMKRLFQNKGAVVGLVLFVIIVLLTVLAPVIAPYGYQDMNMAEMNQSPSAAHWFGTDDMGRDIFSRILYGGRMSLLLGLISTSISLVVGVFFGSVAGYFGGAVDNIIMRVMDIIQAIPGMLLAVIISAVLGNGLIQTTLALAFGTMPGYCRILRGSILTVRQNEYLEAAVADDNSAARIIVKHLLPNAFSPIIVQATMGCASSILMAASLSFIGLGIQPPNAEWGAMLSAGRSLMRDHPHLCLFPGMAIMMVVLSLNLLGDGLRDALDPKLKR